MPFPPVSRTWRVVEDHRETAHASGAAALVSLLLAVFAVALFYRWFIG